MKETIFPVLLGLTFAPFLGLGNTVLQVDYSTGSSIPRGDIFYHGSDALPGGVAYLEPFHATYISGSHLPSPAIYPNGMDATTYKPDNFYTFCTDIAPAVARGGQYTYAPRTFAGSAPSPGVAPPWYSAHPGGYLPSIQKAETLYMRDLNDALSSPTKGAALQLAIWNVLYDSDYSVSSGAGFFYATDAAHHASIAVVIAQANFYLSGLDPAHGGSYDHYDSTWLDPRGLNHPDTQGLLYAPENALLPVPDGGLTAAMLGLALSGLGLLARKLRK
jgi:hypothetical protein